MYIYTITNKLNNNVYVGQTIQKNAKSRWYDHQAHARAGKLSHLSNSIRKYSIENFEWRVIDSSAKDIDELNEKEKYYLNEYRQLGPVYNNREAGNNKTHSKESIEKMRQVHKARHANNEIGGQKRRDGGAMLGKRHPGKGKPNKKWTEEMKAEQRKRMKEVNNRPEKIRKSLQTKGQI